MLLERDGRGHAENFAPVTIRRPRAGGDPSENSRWGDGQVVEVKITALDGDTLIGIAA
jgi:hypothetical protein